MNGDLDRPISIVPKRITVPKSPARSEPAPPPPEMHIPVAEALPQNAGVDDCELGEDHDVFTPAPKTNPVVAAAIQLGRYIGERGSGCHSIRCPNEHEHQPGEQCEALYWEPTPGQPIGRFRCEGHHARKFKTSDFVASLGLTSGQARAQPCIRCLPGHVHLTAAAAGSVLASTGQWFSVDGQPVRLIDRGEQGVTTQHVTDQTLKAVLSREIRWERLKGSEWVRCDPDPAVIQVMMTGQDPMGLPQLNGIARQPFFRADGTLVTTPGYDALSGMFGAFDRSKYDLTRKSRKDAELAFDYLNFLFDEVEFDTDHDRSAALSAVLAAASRPSLRQAPAYSITATGPGSGKSYVAQMIALVAGPGHPFSISYPSSGDEAAKQILACLRASPAVLLFDDMQTDWLPHGALNRMLTSPTTTERVLQTSRTITVGTRVFVMGTGNNIEPVRDMRRRVVTIRLSPKSETPALRRFERDPMEIVRSKRERVVNCALTIIEAFKAAGAPFADVKPIGTYDDWSAWCRQPLLWLGQPDPAQSLIDQVTHDNDGQLLEVLLDVWFRLFKSSSVTVRKLVATARDNVELMDAIADLPVMDGPRVSPGKLGWFLKKNRGRRIGGLRIEHGQSTERNSWRIVAS